MQGITVTTLNATGTLLLDGSAVTIGQTISQSDISAGALTFTPLANDNGAGYDSFAYTVNDGVADSLASATMTIDVTAVNDLPTSSDNTVTATEDTPFVFTDADFGFADVDVTTQPEDTFGTVTTLVSTGKLELNGVEVTLGQNISHDDILAGLLTFTPLKDGNGVGYDSFQFTVNDGIADSLVPSTLTIDVTAVNDLPTSTDNTVTAIEDTTFVFTSVNFGFADADTSDQLQSITVTALPSIGTLVLNNSDSTGGKVISKADFELGGSPVTLGQVISQADIVAGNLKFTPLANANGAGYDSFQFTVNDGVADSSASSTMTIDVTAVNDLPTATNTTVTATEDTTFLFTVTDFGFEDVDTSDQLQGITVTTLSSTGTLALNGSAVVSGQTISRSSISAGELTYEPLTNGNGSSYDSFRFTVSDGVSVSSSSAKMTIDVTAVNDLPTTADNTVIATEDTAFVFALADFGFIGC